MMKLKECAQAWQSVIRLYQSTHTPADAMRQIIDTLGMGKTREVFATLAAIKKDDGRISDANRKFVYRVPINPDSVADSYYITGLDTIHTAHIDQLITELKLQVMNTWWYRLNIYKLSGVDRGNLDHEEFFHTKEEMDIRYRELFQYELFSLNPTAWEKTADGWKRLGGDNGYF